MEDRKKVLNEPCVYIHMMLDGVAYAGKSNTPRNRWCVGNDTKDELNDGYNSDFMSSMYKFGGPKSVKTIWATGEYLKEGISKVESELIELGNYTHYGLNRRK